MEGLAKFGAVVVAVLGFVLVKACLKSADELAGSAARVVGDVIDDAPLPRPRDYPGYLDPKFYPPPIADSTITSRDIDELLDQLKLHRQLAIRKEALKRASGDRFSDRLRLRLLDDLPTDEVGRSFEELIGQAGRSVKKIHVAAAIPHTREAYRSVFGAEGTAAAIRSLQDSAGKLRDSVEHVTMLGGEGRGDLNTAVERAREDDACLIVLAHSVPTEDGQRAVVFPGAAGGTASEATEVEVIATGARAGVPVCVVTCYGDDIATNAPVRFDDMVRMCRELELDIGIRISGATRSQIRDKLRMQRKSIRAQRVAITSATKITAAGATSVVLISSLPSDGDVQPEADHSVPATNTHTPPINTSRGSP